MIKNWIIFNESTNEKFTLEMAQEIIYYFSENYEPSKEMSDIFYNGHAGITDREFIFYETSYDEMNDYIKKLYNLVNTESLTLMDDMIKLYHKIREERKNFPEIFEIEDLFLDLIESDKFDFMVYSNRYNYKIRLSKTDKNNTITLEEYIKYCTQLNNELIRLKSDKYETKLMKCLFEQDYHTTCSFYIGLKSK